MSRACFHIHTKYSFDSLMNPKKILKICKKLNVDEVYITDHNTIRGSLKAKKFEKDFGVEVIIGSEIKTQYGDIIGIYLNDEIRSKDFISVIEEIRSQGGITVLPHPYRGHKDIFFLASKVDLIEIWNARCTPTENSKNRELLKFFKKPPVVGSDAHMYSELGNAIMEYNTIFDYIKKYRLRYSRNYQIQFTNIIGDIKKLHLWNIPKRVIRMIKGGSI